MSGAALMSRREAAEFLGISTDTLDRLRAIGAIAASQVSARLVKYRQSDLAAYIERQCQITPSSRSQLPPTGISSGGKTDIHAALQRARQIAARQKQSSRRSA